MDRFVIRGGRPLHGTVRISGAKNAAVAILPATVLAQGEYRIENIPNIRDIEYLVIILQALGAQVVWSKENEVMTIDTRGVEFHEIPYSLTSKMRASYYFLGSMLGRYSRAAVAMPGGCEFGVNGRPIDLHLKAFEALGAQVKPCSDKEPEGENRMVKAEAEKLLGASIYFDKVSVGATVNTLLAAVRARGITVIENAAREPHVVDLANFLNHMGASIQGAGTDTIKIEGVKELHACEYSIIPDQIEAGTYMVAAAATHGDLCIKNVIPKHLDPITAKLTECGAMAEIYDDAVRIYAPGPLRQCKKLETKPHPGFPTDMQPQFVTMLSLCDGTCEVTDQVWENRFRYTDELNKMGAQIQYSGNYAAVTGVEKLRGTDVNAMDLRAGAAMIIAGLCAEGETRIGEIDHIERGYVDVVEKLSAVGADIRRVTE